MMIILPKILFNNVIFINQVHTIFTGKECGPTIGYRIIYCIALIPSHFTLNPTLNGILMGSTHSLLNYFLLVDFQLFYNTTFLIYIANCKIQNMKVLGYGCLKNLNLLNLRTIFMLLTFFPLSHLFLQLLSQKDTICNILLVK